MKRFLLLASLGLLLGSCGQQGDPQVLGQRSIELGHSTQKIVTKEYANKWNVVSVPSWLEVSKSQGQGNVNFTVKVKIDKVTDVDETAQSKKLKDLIEIEWTAKNAETGKLRKGITKWPVRLNLTKVTGRVIRPSAKGTVDVSIASKPLSGTQASNKTYANHKEADGVIVTYHSSNTRELALQSMKQLQKMKRQAASSYSFNQEALSAAKTLDQLKITPAKRVALGENAVWLKVTDVQGTLAALKNKPGVKSVVRNAKFHALGRVKSNQSSTQKSQNIMQPPVVPTDQYAYLQWAYKLVGYQAAWRDMENTPYTNPVNVAVIDTGVRYDHPDLGGRLIEKGKGALDLVAPTKGSNADQIGDGDGVDTDPTDPSFSGRIAKNSHGTHVTGIIAARWGEHKPACPTCTKTGVVGATFNAPIKVLPIRVLDGEGSGSVAAVTQAIDYAAGKTLNIDGKTYSNPVPVKVINLSLGGAMEATEVEQVCTAISNARQKGILVIAAAGNDGTGDQLYPAACPGAVAIGSLTLSGASAPRKAQYSNYYKEVQLSAPGGSGFLDRSTHNGQKLNDRPVADEIFSTDWNYDKDMPNYQFYSGTSQAAPQVTALAALMMSKGVTKSADDTLQRLIDTATDLGTPGRDPYFGYGMINAATALNAPWTAEEFGLRMQSHQGHSFQPKLDALGRFTAYLPALSYQITVGEDLNGNGVYGEKNEASASTSLKLSLQKTSADLGDLKLK